MRDIIEEVEHKREQARLGGGQHRIDAQHAKGNPRGEDLQGDGSGGAERRAADRAE